MSERTDLLQSIATTVADYRDGEIPKPNTQHVDRWISQFAKDFQIQLLREVKHVLGQMYISRDKVVDVFNAIIKNEKITGDNPMSFWKNIEFLCIQQDGQSQKELLELFSGCLQVQFGFRIENCGSNGGIFMYLDDILFTGSRIGNDLSLWIKQDAPDNANIHILVFVVHTLGEYQMMKKLRKEAKDAGKKIEFHLWRGITLENRKYYKDTSEVLWPTSIPADNDLIAYIDQEKKFPLEFRQPGGILKHNYFSSEKGRQLLEQEFLLAGMKIRGLCKNPSNAMRPLGFSAFGLGFGSMIVTYRNCPNNCPLALWWGDPDAPPSNPLSKWYPLVPRKTYGRNIDFDEIWY